MTPRSELPKGKFTPGSPPAWLKEWLGVITGSAAVCGGAYWLLGKLWDITAVEVSVSLRLVVSVGLGFVSLALANGFLARRKERARLLLNTAGSVAQAQPLQASLTRQASFDGTGDLSLQGIRFLKLLTVEPVTLEKVAEKLILPRPLVDLMQSELGRRGYIRGQQEYGYNDQTWRITSDGLAALHGVGQLTDEKSV